jgi:transcriptional regulator
MVRALVGIEIPVHSITGKFKLSQNQPAVNQASLQEALLAETNPNAHTMAHWIAHATAVTHAKP